MPGHTSSHRSSHALSVLNQVHTWQSAGIASVLCTLLQAPEVQGIPPGSIMAINQDGDRCGHIVMPGLEDWLLTQVFAWGFTQHKPGVLHGHADGTGLRIFLEPVTATSWVTAARKQLQQHHGLLRKVALDGSGVEVESADPQAYVQLTANHLRHYIPPRFRVFVFGDAPVAQEIRQIARRLGYQIVVYPQTGHTLTDTPLSDLSRWLKKKLAGGHCAVLCLHRDMKRDLATCLTALEQNCEYVGLLGSREYCARIRESLHQQGISTDQFNHLHAPAGFPIGSETAVETACAVLAQVIALRKGITLSLSGLVDHKRVVLHSTPVRAEIVRPRLERTRCSIREEPLGNPWNSCCDLLPKEE